MSRARSLSPALRALRTPKGAIAGGWLLPLKAAVRKAETIVEGTVVEAVLALA